MTTIESIVDELRNIHNGDAWHGASLIEALAGITPEQAAAHPIKNAHSIWEIVLHIARWEKVFRRRLAGEKASEPEEGDFPADIKASETAWEQVLAELNDEHEKMLQVISGLSDDLLETKVSHKDYSVRFLLRSIVRHHVYHAGQIAVLRKGAA